MASARKRKVNGVEQPLTAEERRATEREWAEEAAKPKSPRMIRKSVILSRLSDEQIERALGVMSAAQRERWRAPDQPLIGADNSELLAILKAVGAKPEMVLADP